MSSHSEGFQCVGEDVFRWIFYVESPWRWGMLNEDDAYVLFRALSGPASARVVKVYVFVGTC